MGYYRLNVDGDFDYNDRLYNNVHRHPYLKEKYVVIDIEAKRGWYDEPEISLDVKRIGNDEDYE